eukprot:CAMPEP_0113849972 /NCGR_PEP_ID=MMETSP0372-20130328/3516_1 /TAXON_ID=340204 /ORGANISM="Lankesteria abbotti" /LENGTH=151 /DNA_ID=CAMNT_0000819999 /DNA_START=47 /DNA_END=503 /DNA_ORIENTATION=+ /assembly_acc=CAM_ASM_000359
MRRAQGIQEEFDYLNRVMVTQRQELEALRETNKHRISDRDLTELRIKLLRFQDENSKLQLERSKLQHKVDEMQEQLSKHGPDRSITCATLLGLDKTLTSTIYTEAHLAEQEACAARKAELEDAIAHAEHEKVEQAKVFKAKKDALQKKQRT